MRKTLLSLVCGLLMCGSQQTGAQRLQPVPEATRYAEGKVRVKLQPEVSVRIAAALAPSGQSRQKAAYVKTGLSQLDRVSQQVKAVSMTRVFPYAGKDEAKHKAAGLDRWYDISFSAEGMTAAQVRNLYRAVPGVDHAQRIVQYQLSGSNTFRPISPDDIARAAKAAATMPFNDPLLPDQWHYHNTGSLTGAKAGADINVFPAWKEGNTGSKDVVVAIIDGGFQVDHPDLKDNVWINEAELNGKPGVDDDGDGFVDDIYGYNFVIGSANVTAHNHGTHVAGTVGATNNNGIGVSGVAGGGDGSGGVKMMVCQVFDSNASDAADANFAAALVYAADRGASIAQCSWGAGSPDDEDESITEAVKYFTKNGGGQKMSGGLCIFASGNTSAEGNYYPGCLDECVAVAATTPMGDVAYYSSHGPWVDVAAPGGYADAGEKYEVLSTTPNSSYGYMEGTSMACPHVSGVAALILSKYGNPNFSNETLRTLLVSSVNEFTYPDESYVGKCGSGIIDAYKALQGSEESVPGAVTDFKLTASHDNVLVEWTIPESEEKSIDHHVIYYSTEPFTQESELSKLDRVNVDTKYKYSGDRVSHEIDGLKAMTTYYVALVAYNRWGKSSAMSEVKTAKTNEGPTLTLQQRSTTLNVDGSNGDGGKSNTTIFLRNTGKGILKYELTAATKSAVMSASSRTEKPAPGRIAPFAGKMSATENSTSQWPVVTADYKAKDYPDTLRYCNRTLKAFLGENDTELPNALAQYFYVDPKKYPNGFNLTDIVILGSYGSNPAIEIYDGSRSIQTASLLTRVGYEEWGYSKYLPLEEQMFFAPGRSFWVVAKFPAGQKNPLGGCLADVDGVENYSFYSSDNGETWTQLSQVLKGSNFESVAQQMTWGVFAVSKNPDWSSVLTPDPQKGEIAAGSRQKITLSNDGQKLVNGTYKFNMRVKTNEAKPADNTIGVTLNVSGYKPVVTSKKMIDYGSLLVGQEKTLSIEIANEGYGAFATTSGTFYSYKGEMACSSDQFQTAQSLSAVQARSSRLLDVTFKPTKAGSFSGNVTLTDKNGLKHSFIVCGTAIDPARLTCDKSDFDLGTLRLGDNEKEAVISIRNDGKYPLQYVFPKFSDETISGSARAHRYGYTWQTNIDNTNRLDYAAAPELDDEVDITSQFNDRNWQSSAVPIGFKFPFYGTDYQQLYINSRGGLQMQLCKNNTIGALVPQPAFVKELGYISGYGNNGFPGNMYFGPKSKVSYGHKDGKLYVIYKDVTVQGLDGTEAVMSFHFMLDAQGNITIYYDDYDPALMRESGKLNYIGVCDIEGNDPMSVTYSDMARAGYMLYSKIKTGSVIRIVAPGKSMITSLSSTDGYVGIGETREIRVKAKANDQLFAGQLTNHLIMLTNDPQNQSKVFNISADITGDAFKGDARVDSSKVDFGRVFRTSTQKRTVRVLNNGTKAVSVSSVSTGSSYVSVPSDVKGGFTVSPNESKDIRLTLSTDNKRKVSDVLTVNYADGQKATIPVTAEVIGAPKLTITPDSKQATTPWGQNTTADFTVKNDGDETLTLSAEAADWFNFADLTDSKASTMDYTYSSSDNDEGVVYDWVDITADADEHANFAYFANQTDYKEVALPFEFPFYGKKYTKMYIYNTGFIQFTKPSEDYKMWPEPPAGLPNGETFYRNILCPLWGSHSMAPYVDDGIFYKKYDDHVVVTFKNYGNSVMDGFNFQALLYRDGSAKFQYQLDPTGQLNGIFGIAGAQDSEAKRGFTVPANYTQPLKALWVRPTMSYTVAPGASAAMPVELKADKLADTYDYTLHLRSNDPQQEKKDVPVRLTVTGTAVPVIPAKISLKSVYDNVNQLPAEVEFEVRNDGHKAFVITDITSPILNEDANHQFDAEIAVYTKGSGSDSPDPGPLSLQTSDDSYSWQPFWPGKSEPITVGNEPVRMKFMYFNVTKPVKASDDIKFTIKDMNAVTTHVDVEITEAPRITFSRDEISISGVQKDYTGAETLSIGNSGKYTLDYTLALDPTGRDASLEEDGDNDDNIGGLYAPAVPTRELLGDSTFAAKMRTYTFEPIADTQAKAMRAAAKARKDDAYVWDDPIPGNDKSPDAPDHTNALYYPVMQPISVAKVAVMGTGESHLDENFYAATRYTAPAEGFNLTHVFFVGTVGPLENVDIEASVVLGDNVASSKNVIGRGKLHVDKDESENGGYYGTPRTLKLDAPVFINPNDTFYVVLKYPAGYMGNALMVSKDGDTSENRYMAYLADMGGWVDIEAAIDAAYSYGAFGYFMTCLEQEPGKPWIQLSPDSKPEGSVEVGKSAELKFDINAGATYYEKGNKATLVVRSNDPSQPLVNYHIYLDRNAAPTITVPKSTATVAQGAETRVSVKVADAEGDAFKVSVDDANHAASIASALNADGTAEGITVGDDGVVSVEAGRELTMEVSVAPSYNMNEGLNLFTVYATDANGNESQADSRFNVEFTNRPPQYVGQPTYGIEAGTTCDEIPWNHIFVEPDGQEMTFDVSLRSTLASVYRSNTGFIIVAKQRKGTTKMTLSATDSMGAKTEVNVTLTVGDETGIGGVSADADGIKASAENGGVGITLDAAASSASFYVFDAAGKLVAQKSVGGTAAGETVHIATSSLAPGVYTVNATVDGQGSTVKFAVRQ